MKRKFIAITATKMWEERFYSHKINVISACISMYKNIRYRYKMRVIIIILYECESSLVCSLAGKYTRGKCTRKLGYEQSSFENLEDHLPSQVRHVVLREGYVGVSRQKLGKRTRKHSAVASVHLLGDFPGVYQFPALAVQLRLLLIQVLFLQIPE